MTTTLNLSEPTVRERDRSITVRWDTGKKIPATEYQPEKKVLLTLTISHHKAGVNYMSGTRRDSGEFTATVVNETESEGIIGVMLFSGILIEKRVQARFNRKKMQEFADEMRADIEALIAEGDEQIMPYANGEKAGLA